MIPHLFQKNKNSFYVLIGNFLEFFDLYVYVHLAHIINKYYFVGIDEGFLYAFTFANLYLIAPIGCLIFAYLGDMLGRKKVIVSTSVLMAFCSSLIGILPTHASIGAYAGFILIFLRILQGVSLSGEPLATGVYIVESTPLRYAPFFIALTGVGECLGGAVALGTAYIAIDLWGEPAWRVPFYLGVFFCFFSLWLRWNLAESKDYLKYTKENKKFFTRQREKSIWAFYRTLNFHNRNFICWIGLGLAYGTAFCISYVYLGKLLMDQFGFSAHALLLHNLQVALCEMVLLFCWGAWVVAQNLNVKKFMLLRTLFFLCLLPLLARALSLSPSVEIIFIIQVMLVSFSGKGPIMPSLSKGFPIIGRYSFMAIGWAGSKLINFFIAGVILNFISASASIAWMLGVMFFVGVIFLMSVVFYIPYAEHRDEVFQKITPQLKKASA